LAEAGEWFINKSAVAHYGDALFHALNSRSLSRESVMAAIQGFSGGGSVLGRLHIPSLPPLRFAEGGAVPGPAETFRIEVGGRGINSSSGRSQVKAFVDELTREVRRLS